MSLAMRLYAPNLEEPSATDDGKVPALSCRVFRSDQEHAGLLRSFSSVHRFI